MHHYVANKNVLRNCLKLFPPIIGFRKLSGKEFQTDGPATQKAELSWWHGITRSCRVADRRCCHDATGWHNSMRYKGTWSWRQLNTTMPSLYTTHSGKSSQRSSVWRSRDKPRSNVWVPLTTRAAAFNTHCSSLVVAFALMCNVICDRYFLLHRLSFTRENFLVTD